MALQVLPSAVTDGRPRPVFLGLFALLYALGVWAGSALLLVPGGSATLYPPSGILLAALLSAPMRQWHWWIAAAFPVEVVSAVALFDFPAGLACGTFLANTLEATTGAAIAHRLFGAPFRLRGLREVFVFVVAGACVAPLVGGTVAALLLDLAGRDRFATILPLWWVGDASGILITAPLVLGATDAIARLKAVPRHVLAEMALMLIAIVVVSHFTLSATRPYAYLMLPILLWAALRFGVVGAAFAMAVLAVSVVLHTKLGIGVFASAYEDPHARQWNVQLFLSVFALTALIVGAITTQRRQALTDLEHALAATEGQVDRRTRELRESERRLQRAHDTFLGLIRNDPFGVFVVDGDLRFVEASTGARAILETDGPLQRSGFEALARRLWPESFASHLIERLRSTLATGTSHTESTALVRRADTGEAEAYHWHIERVVLNDDRAGVVCYLYDLSKRVQWEEAMIGADRRKDDFLATLAHELRNPLGTLRVAAAILERSGPTPEPVKGTLAMVHRQVDHMERLANDLLDLGRIRSGKLLIECKPLDVVALLQASLAESRAALSDRAVIEALPALPIVVDADAERLRQVFSNLVDNARKFTAPEGRIEVRVAADDQTVEIVVTDDGEGIPADRLGSIFGMFEQVEAARNKARGGLGIGLALAREIVTMHGGSIEAMSEGPGRGATFIVRIPRLRTDGAGAS